MRHLFITVIMIMPLTMRAQHRKSATDQSETYKIESLKKVYLLRVKSNDFIKAKTYDSAAFYLSQITTDATLSNATDNMNLACCLLHMKDTAGFRRELIKSIDPGGADSAIIPRYFRSLNEGDHAFFNQYLLEIFPGYRAQFLKKIDPEIKKEMEEIAFLDQLCRKTNDNGFPSDTSSINFKHIRVIGRYVDSVNFERVAGLIRQNRYPGFHTFGINSADYDPILMHVSDIGEEQWHFIYSFLKRQLLSGDIMQNQVVAIVTRHYRRNNCTYYGIKKWGLTTPCDCDQVDKFREEIGLESLKDEYTRLKQNLPECYQNQ
jgi:hypothetical protein